MPEGLPADKLLSRLLQAAHQEGLVGQEMDGARLGALFRVFAGNVRALQRYAPQPFEGQALLLQAEGQPEPRARAQEHLWRELARGGLELRRLPGDHYTLLRDPCVGLLAAEIARRLE